MEHQQEDDNLKIILDWCGHSMAEYLKDKEIKNDFVKILKLMKHYKDKVKLYHFTDERNLESIDKMGGLYSWRYLDNHAVDYFRGGNELSRKCDISNGVDNDVSLGFIRNHPMLFTLISNNRIKNPHIYEINPVVCFVKDTKFCNTIANTSGVDVNNTAEAFERISFGSAIGPCKKAEALVHEFIPKSLFLNISPWQH